jgi:hypothetical protein
MSLHHSQLPWLIYALGGGLGHLTRSLALANIASLSRPVIIISNSQFAPIIQAQNTNENISIHVISPDATRQEGMEQVISLLTFTPCVLIIDALVRGIWGELAFILPKLSNLPKVLILRDLPIEYVIEKDLENFIENNYDLVIVPGESEQPPLANLTKIKYTEPWLICSPEQLFTRQEARSLMNIDLENAKNKTILILASGKPEEQEIYGFLAKDLTQKLPWVNIRFISLIYQVQCPFELWIKHFPAFEYLPAADLVIGGCGYNLFYECMALNIPLVCFPWDRIYDRQRARSQKAETLGLGTVKVVSSIEEAYYAVSEIFSQQIAQESLTYGLHFHPLDFKNGVKKSVDLIEKLIPQKWDQIAYQAMEANLKSLENVEIS